MGDLPLRTPTHRRFGGPLPRQLPNAPHAHPAAELLPSAPRGCPLGASPGISPVFTGLSPSAGQVAYVLLTRAPVAGGRKQAYAPAAPRLACVKPVASVHPEPGSNSSLLLSCFLSFQKCCLESPSGKRLLRGRRMTDYRCFLFRTLRNLRKLVLRLPIGAPRTLALVLLSNLSIAILSMSSPGCFLVFFGSAEKLCKVTGFSRNLQIFSEFFSKLFSRLPAGGPAGNGSPARPGALPGGPGRPPPPFLPESDREVTRFFRTSKIFQRKIPDFNIISQKQPQNRPEKAPRRPPWGKNRGGRSLTLASQNGDTFAWRKLTGHGKNDGGNLIERRKNDGGNGRGEEGGCHKKGTKEGKDGEDGNFF